MSRRLLCVCVFGGVMFIAGTVELDACGDKFLRLGQSSRHRSYAAVNRASILVFVPASVKRSEVSAFESGLKRAGHRPVTVRNMDALTRALREQTYDIIISGIADAAVVKTHAVSVSSHADVLPVVSRGAKGALTGIEREYRFAIDLDGPRLNPLSTIDDVMEARLARVRTAAALTQQ